MAATENDPRGKQHRVESFMWKYILASTLLVIGVLEIVLALHRGLREALMQTSPLRLKQAESPAFLFAGISALSDWTRDSLLWSILVGEKPTFVVHSSSRSQNSFVSGCGVLIICSVLNPRAAIFASS